MKKRQPAVRPPSAIELITAVSAIRDPQQAIRQYRDWLQARPQDPHAWAVCFNLGVQLKDGGDDAGAEQAYRRAIELNPDCHEAQFNLGSQLERLQRPQEALAQWRSMIDSGRMQLPRDQAICLMTLNNLGRLHEQLREFEQAEAWLRRSLEPDAEQPDALQHYVHLRQKQCKWPIYQEFGDVTLNRQLLGTSALATLALHDDPALQLMSAREFVRSKVTASGPRKPVRTRAPGERLRIGYLSGDLCLHAVGLLTVELFELHDREQFEVFGFCWSAEDGSALRERIVKAFDHHLRIGHLSDEQAAALIEACGIDILVDLQGLTSGARPNILARRPAPVQVSYLGLPATSAIPGVDYIVADRFVYPPELAPYMTEKPLYVPRCYQVSDRQREVGPPLTRTECGLPENKFVFAAFNNNYKITPEVYGCWMRILQQVPGSVLWLMADNRWSEQNLRDQAVAQGVDQERLIFAGRAQPAEYMARLALPDLFLDTFPYNAGTTANDILWMGTPILTRSGRTYISRMCGSLLTAVGLPDLITFSLDEYERQAVRLGNNPGRIASYKRYLAEQGRASGLFDMPTLVRDIETALIGLLLPEPVSVPVHSVEVRSPDAPRPDAERPFKLLIEGWRGINHSFAIVNQFQLLELVRMPGLELAHRDMPFRFAHWSQEANSAGFHADDESVLKGIRSAASEADVDAIYRIHAPLNFRPNPGKGRLAVFAVTETGLDANSLAPGNDIEAFQTDGGLVITPSNWSRNLIVEFGFRPELVHVVPHAASPDYFFEMPQAERLQARRALGISDDKVVLLNIGAALWNKGIDVLLKAFAIARQKRKDLRLLFKDQRNTYGIAGDQYVQSTLLAAGLWSEDLIGSITLIPSNLTMDQMRSMYAIADCYVSPYRAEGFNLPACEAMACGTPVIVTDGGATDDFVHGSMHRQIESMLHRNVKIQDRVINAYREPNLDHLVALLLQTESKSSILLQNELKFLGWTGPTRQLLSSLNH